MTCGWPHWRSRVSLWAKLSDERRFGRNESNSFLDAVAWFVARRDNGRIGGIAGLLQPQDGDPDLIGIDPDLIGMWVDPAERGQGIGHG